MGNLLITKAKPNPFGKDRSTFLSQLLSQLPAEWIDFQNVGTQGVKLDNIALYHQTFDAFCRFLSFAPLLHVNGTLQPGEIVRVHSGHQIPIAQLSYEDRLGADYHLFINFGNYVWNNSCGDKAGLWDEFLKQWVDTAFYDPNPPEGAILRRIGNKLVL